MRTQALSSEISRLSEGKTEFNPRGVAGLQASIRGYKDITILDLCGRSTRGDESNLLSGYIQKLAAGGVRKLLMNFSNTTQVDSSGISVIIATFVSLRGTGGDLRLLCPRGRVLELFTLLRLPKIIPTFEDETQALASFAEGIDSECGDFDGVARRSVSIKINDKRN